MTFFKPKFRIVEFECGSFEAHVKPWWSPFWRTIKGNLETELGCTYRLNQRGEAKKLIIRYLNRHKTPDKFRVRNIHSVDVDS